MDHFFRSIYCVIKCVKTKRVLKHKFASSVFQNCNAKAQKMQICVTGPQCVNTCVMMYSHRQYLYCIVVAKCGAPVGCLYGAVPVWCGGLSWCSWLRQYTTS
jgi:hypothetical protein